MKILASLLALIGSAFSPAQRAHAQPDPPALDERAELYNDIGARAVEAVGDERAKILIYGEAARGTVGMFIRYQLPGGNTVKQLVPSDDNGLDGALYRLWNFSCASTPPECWRGMVYLVDDGRVTIRLLYEGQVDARPLWEKSRELTEEFFPGLPVEPASSR